MQNFSKIEQKGDELLGFIALGVEYVFELLWMCVSLWMFPKVMMLGRFSQSCWCVWQSFNGDEIGILEFEPL
jgi:hypothetical protein